MAYVPQPRADVEALPLAINAGLEQLGKHGSLITKEFGSNTRLAAVLTSMPLATDQPVNIGWTTSVTKCRLRLTQNQGEKCHPGVHAVLHLAEVGGPRIGIDVGRDLPHPRQRVHERHLLLGAGHGCGAYDV